MNRASPDCPSELLLDRLVAREVPDAERTVVERHLATCAPCASRRRQREEERAIFAASAPPLGAATPAPTSSPRRRRRWTLLAGAAALAAAGLLLLRPRLPEGESTKGLVALRVFVDRAGQVHEYSPGDTVATGDRVAFSLRLEPRGGTRPPTHVAVLGRDGSGEVRLYHPPGGAAAVPVTTTDDGALPFSLALDASPGPEAFFVFLCQGPTPVSELRVSLSGASPPGCTRHDVVLEKRP